MSTVITNGNDFNETITLYEWSGCDGKYGVRSEEELKSTFLNLDKALHYVHNHGYCVKSFSPLEIELLNNSIKYIKFNTLLEMPTDYSVQAELKREDIFNSACLQIGLYTNSLRYLKKDFLIEHFEEFAKNIPADVVPYYRGIIERGASVYLSEYDFEKRKKDLENMENQVNDAGGYGSNKVLVKTNGLGIVKDNSNESINDKIYKQINGLKDSAFINYLLIPTLLLLTGVIIGFIVLVLGK